MHNIWLLACFLLACHFYGVGFNPIFLLPVVLGPMLVFATTPTVRFAALRDRGPTFFWVAVSSLVLIALHHTWFSVSPDTSFMPSLVLACLPLWAIAAAIIEGRRQLWLLVSLLVAWFALLSVIDYVSVQQRAHAPLRDPGNYVTLLFLVWAPWMVVAAQEARTRGMILAAGMGAFVFVLAQLATHSRFAMLAVGAVIAIMLVLCLRQRRGWGALAAVAVAAAAALAVYVGLDQTGVNSAFDGTGQENGGNHRLLLWQAALDAVGEMGGVNGTGVYTFSLLYPMFRSPLEQATAGLLVHNDFLQVLLEGGVWLSVPLLVMAVCIGIASLRGLLGRSRPAMQVGAAVALALATAHATVNFVFYILPLVVLFAILAAAAFVPPLSVEHLRAARGFAVGKWLLVSLLAVNVGLLALDVLSLGVFSGQTHVPGAAHIRAAPERMLDYARLAGTLNPRRGLTAFAEARLLEAKLDAAPTPLLETQTRGAYRRAHALDPWNPLLLLSVADFQARYPQPGVDTGREKLLYGALTLDPADVYANSALLHWHASRGEIEAATAIAENVARWCALLGKKANGEALFAEVLEFAERNGAAELQQTVARCGERAKARRAGGRQETWLMRWLRERNAA